MLLLGIVAIANHVDPIHVSLAEERQQLRGNDRVGRRLGHDTEGVHVHHLVSVHGDVATGAAAGDADNVLLDFSTAGYDHGASLPPDWTPDDYKANGYTVYNICDYGAVANDEVSDRDAYLAIVAKINKKAKAKAVIYFPAGRYILHTAADDVNGVSSTITLSSGYVVLKGDGRDKTTIAMGALMVPKDSTKMWSSDPMLTIKNQAGIKDTLANVTASADINTWKVTVDNASKLSAGMWVCLYMLNKNASVILKEMGR